MLSEDRIKVYLRGGLEVEGYKASLHKQTNGLRALHHLTLLMGYCSTRLMDQFAIGYSPFHDIPSGAGSISVRRTTKDTQYRE